jgi:NAD(P)-dependent dehydrogenase (short-subunit alcohol dehydrogenase family)
MLDYFLGVMLRAPFRLAREVLPHMKPGSAIINVTSTLPLSAGCVAAPIRRRRVGSLL